jgi:chorismate dehydratase
MTSLPAVLAVWAARREAITPQLVQDFQDSLAFGLQHLDAIAGEAAVEMQLPVADLRRYLSENIDYHLDEENLQGLTRYYVLAAQLGLIPANLRTIELAPQPCGPARYMDFVVANRPGL